MPYVNIKITDKNVSTSDKLRLIKGVTVLLKQVLNKDPQTTIVIIDEIKTDNWGINSQNVSSIRKKLKSNPNPSR